MDPYVKVFCGSRIFQTKTDSNAGKFPHWHSVFQMHRTNEDHITFSVFDEDVGTDDYIGQGQLDLSSITSGGPNMFAGEIPLLYKGKSSGMLMIEVMFQADAQYVIAPGITFCFLY